LPIPAALGGPPQRGIIRGGKPIEGKKKSGLHPPGLKCRLKSQRNMKRGYQKNATKSGPSKNYFLASGIETTLDIISKGKKETRKSNLVKTRTTLFVRGYLVFQLS